MFEVLLQADRALASGALDRAEQAYWQLVELDPTNAIATAGLARVALARGDRRLARKFADKALSIDPESILARNVIDALEGRGEVMPVAPNSGDLPLQAVQRLEAVGRKRAAAEEDGRGTDAADAGLPISRLSAASHTPAIPRRGPILVRETLGETPAAPRPMEAPPLAEAGPAEAEPAEVPEPAESGEAEAPRAASRKAGKGDLPPAVPPGAPLPSMPKGEPLRERRQAGRRVAPVAAAAAQASPYTRVPKRSVLGDRAKRQLEQQPKLPPRSYDAFSQAETAAAIEAVDEADEPAVAEAAAAEAAAAEAASAQGAGAAAAQPAEASIARAAEAADAEWDAALAQATAEAEAQAEIEAEAARAAEAHAAEAQADEADAAEARAHRATRPTAAEERAAEAAEADAAEARAAQAAEAARHGIAPRPAPSERTGELDARFAEAELESTELAAAEEASSRIAEAEFEADVLEAVGMPGGHKQREPLDSRPLSAEEASEEDAEAAALREALEMVLGGEKAAGPAAEPEPGTKAAGATDTGKGAEQRRKGLFGRFRGG